MDALIPPSAADTIVAGSLRRFGTESVPLARAIGRTLASPIHADRDLPPYSRAMMDGIAVAAESIHGATTIPIHGLHAAGDPPPPPLPPGQAWEIMTGACVPADCDTIIPYEEFEWRRRSGAGGDGSGPAQVSITGEATPGQFIHPAGSDAKAGDSLVPAGVRIGPAEVAIAASVGLGELEVRARPRITLISTGDEAIPVDATPQPWQIRRSNGPMLEALLRHHGHVAILHHIPDEAGPARRTLHAALDSSDLVVLCGGISKGKRDLIRPLLEERLGAPAFHGVLQRPGKPLAFWPGPPLVFALPGNPVSVLATFTRYMLPTLARLEGREPPQRTLDIPDGIEPLPKLTWLLPLDRSGKPLPPGNSGDFVSISGTAGFLEIPPAAELAPSQPLRFYSSTAH